MLRACVLAAAGCAALIFASQATAAAAWEPMAESSATVRIEPKSDRISIELPLVDRLGRQRYVLWCEGGSEKYLDRLSDTTGINYVAPLMCVLNEGNKRSEASLLAEDDVGPWHTRGQFAWEQLTGECGRYPEYGRVRHFRLRGFVLTLEAADPVLVDGHLSAFDLRISVKNDPTATSSMAARAAYLPPAGDCSVVRAGNEPRMCRDWAAGGSYVRCLPQNGATE